MSDRGAIPWFGLKHSINCNRGRIASAGHRDNAGGPDRNRRDWLSVEGVGRKDFLEG
jgi:hypothetical protein